MRYPKWGNCTTDVGTVTDLTVGLLTITTGRKFWMRGFYWTPGTTATTGGINIFDLTAGASGGGAQGVPVACIPMATHSGVAPSRGLTVFSPPGLKFSTGVSVAREVSGECTTWAVGCFGYEE